MPSFPNRCEHIKVNGTQCACPALRRNRFCYFHKSYREQRIALNTDRLRNDRARRARNLTIELPVLEDANSIQVSLMQVIRLLLAGRLDPKNAGLVLYALQTASSNLGRTNFEPIVHNVVIDPKAVGETRLDRHVWEYEDFEEEEEYEDEEAAAEAARAQAEAEARREAKRQAEVRARAEAEAERLMAEGRIEYAKELERERREDARRDARREVEERRRLGLDEPASPATKPTATTPPATPTPATTNPATTKPATPTTAKTAPTIATTPAQTASTPTKPPEPATAATTAKSPTPSTTTPATTAPPATKTTAPAPTPAGQAVVTPTGRAVLQPASPHRRRPPVPSVEEIRKNIKKQVQQAMPEIIHALKQKHSPRSG
jgi:hypothetical protein